MNSARPLKRSLILYIRGLTCLYSLWSRNITGRLCKEIIQTMEEGLRQGFLLSAYYVLGLEDTLGNIKVETQLGEILKGC